MRTRVKICGVRCREDALFSAECGADAVGAVFISGSPREVSASEAARLFAELPPFVTRVGLFRNPDDALVDEVSRLAGLSLLQFHGDEPDAKCAGFGLPFVKAINGDEPEEIARMYEAYPSAAGFVIDSVSMGEGGTGRTFDWGNWPRNSGKPLILAGGLTPENVSDAVRRLNPWGVDVSTGVEDGVKGEKSHLKIRCFIGNARSAREGAG